VTQYTYEEKKRFNKKYYNTIDKLSSYIELKKYLDVLVDEWMHWINKRLDISGGMAEMGSGGLNSSDSLTRALSNIEYLEMRIGDKINDVNDKLVNVIETIDSVENKGCRMILRYRYLDDMDLLDVSEAINYSYAQTKRLHRQGIYAILNKDEPQ